MEQDIARLTFIALRNENINGKLLTFAGPRAWTTQEVKMDLSNQKIDCKSIFLIAVS